MFVMRLKLIKLFLTYEKPKTLYIILNFQLNVSQS